MKGNKRVFDAVVTLGLDKVTGVSPRLEIKDIEDESGERVTGNGCTIRRDQHPWSCFRIKKHYNGRSVVAIEFQGYKTVGDEIEDLEDQNQSSNQRINTESAKITKRKKEISRLRSLGGYTSPMYSQRSL